MLTELEFAIHRFATYAREVLQPAIYEPPHRLSVAAFQCADPIPLAEAIAAAHMPVDVGWRWGPAWSTAWFHVTGTVPEAMAGRTVALRFSSGTEALLWDNGAPRRGFDCNRDALILFEPAAGGETIDSTPNAMVATATMILIQNRSVMRLSFPFPRSFSLVHFAARGESVANNE